MTNRFFRKPHKTKLKAMIQSHALWLTSNGDKGERLTLRHINLKHSDFRLCILNDAIFEDCDLRSCNFSGSKLKGALLLACNSSFNKFDNANLEDANLQCSNLTNSSFYKANLINADLRYCDLKSVDFSEANLTHSNLNYCVLSNLIIDNKTKFKNTAIFEGHIIRMKFLGKTRSLFKEVKC